MSVSLNFLRRVGYANSGRKTGPGPDAARSRRSALVFTLAVLIAGVGSLPARSQDNGLAFLRIGVDAEGLARGDAGVASAHNAFATYWNPAGLASDTGNQVAVSHHIWIADVRTYAAAAKFALGEKTGVGIAMTATGAGDLQARESPGEALGFFDAQFVSAGLSLGRRIGVLRAGVSVKYLSERIYTNSANGYAFDVGVQAGLLDGGLNVGAALQNVGKMERLNAQATRLPRILRAGVELFPFRILAYLDDTPLLNTALLLETTYNTVTESTQFHVGLSGEVLETVTVRAGYLSDDVLRDFSFGVGLVVSELTFDYALLPFEQGFGGPAHVFSVAFAY